MTIKFICDGMLGKLCKLLRIIGIDCAYSNEGMAILVSARKEGRVILTCNSQLRNREGVFFVEATEPAEQLREVVETHGLWDEIMPFSRCVVCNKKLVPVAKEDIKGRVPYYTYQNFDEYAECRQCNRVYWKGSHYQKMLKEVEAILGLTFEGGYNNQ
jgi:uncharacterized protein with PIN domain